MKAKPFISFYMCRFLTGDNSIALKLDKYKVVDDIDWMPVL